MRAPMSILKQPSHERSYNRAPPCFGLMTRKRQAFAPLSFVRERAGRAFAGQLGEAELLLANCSEPRLPFGCHTPHFRTSSDEPGIHWTAR